MSKETMQLGEEFQANIIRTKPDVKPRHKWIGWGLIAALLAGGAGYFAGDKKAASSFKERPGLHEVLGQKISGVLYYDVIRSAINKPLFPFTTAFAPTFENTHFGPIPNTVVNAGENMLEDCFENNTGSACTTVANFEFHGLGTSSAAIAETDTGCTTELTTQYASDNVRPTGTQTNNGGNIYRTVATNTVDAGATIEEFCLMSQAATGGGTMWTRILTGTIVLSAADGLQTTYDLTIE